MYRGPNDPQWWPDQRYRPARLSLEQRLRRLGYVGLAALAAIIVIACAVAALLRQSPPAGQTSTVSTADATATATPPPTNTTAPSSPPIPMSSAVLGGGAQAFLDLYGMPNLVNGGPPKYYRSATYKITTSAGVAVEIEVDQDDNGRVWRLILNPPDATSTSWSSQTTQGVVTPLLPADRKFIKNAPDGDGTYSVGTRQIYTSAALAASFDAGSFTDGTNPVAPGTFSVSCEHYTVVAQPGTNICYVELGVATD